MKTFKILLAITLCLALVVGTLPMIQAAGEPEQSSYTLQFPPAPLAANLTGVSPTGWLYTKPIFGWQKGYDANGTVFFRNTPTSGSTGAAVYGAKVWSDEYTYTTTFTNEWGGAACTAGLIFNEQGKEINTYYAIVFEGAQKIDNINGSYNIWLRLYKNGVVTSETRYDGGPFDTSAGTGAVITIHQKDGAVTITGKSGSAAPVTFFDNFPLDPAYVSGRVGLMTSNSNAIIRALTVTGTATDVQVAPKGKGGNDPWTLLPGSSKLQPKVTCDFSVPLNPTPITQDNVKVYTDYNGTKYATTLTRAQYKVGVTPTDPTQLWLDFKEDLQPSQKYRIEINTQISDADHGTKLLEPVAYEFTSRPEIQTLYDMTYDLTAVGGTGYSFSSTMTKTGDVEASAPVGLVTLENKTTGALIAAAAGDLNLDNTPKTIGGMGSSATSDLVVKGYAFESFETLVPALDVVKKPFAGTDFAQVSYDLARKKVTVFGTLPNGLPGRVMSVAALSADAGVTLSNMKDNPYGIQKVDTFQTGAGGAFSITFPLASAFGTISLYLSGVDFTAPLPLDSLKIADLATQQSAAADLKAGVTVDKLKAYANDLGYNMSPAYKALLKSDASMAKLAALLTGKPINDTDVAGIGATQQMISAFALLEAYNEGIGSVVIFNGELSTPELLGLDTLNAYAFYANADDKGMTAAGKKLVQAALQNPTPAYDDLEKLQNAFVKNVVLYGVKNCSLGGSGHITELLLQNGQAAGIKASTITAYNQFSSKGTVNNALLNARFTTIEQLDAAILAAMEPAPTQAPTSSGSKTGTGTVTREPAPVYTPVPTSTPAGSIQLKDMEGNEWAVPAVERLMTRKILEVPADGSFEPSRSITRAEFTKMVVASLGLALDSTATPFEDVKPDDWSAPYVAAAKKAGIISGIDATHFGGSEAISRQDVATILYRAFKGKIVIPEDAQDAVFSDAKQIDRYAYDAVMTLAKAGVINGMGDGTFQPQANCTRAQSAKLIDGISQ